jgi:putative oxidoreductase
MLNRYFTWFEQRAEWGALVIRLAVGVRLVQGTADNVFSYARMEEFAGFLAAHGTPFPLVGAFLSAYVQFICGILVMLGLFTRPAGLLIAINFLFALVLAHRATPFLETWPAAMMLAGGLFFLFNGSGAFALDRLMRAGSRDRLPARRQPSLS